MAAFLQPDGSASEVLPKPNKMKFSKNQKLFTAKNAKESEFAKRAKNSIFHASVFTAKNAKESEFAKHAKNSNSFLLFKNAFP